jgi:hydroxymethylpyrimidine kinase/phosphomethylpyrimidine kinase
MVSKSGAALLKPDAVAVLRRRLFPLARIVTPNLPEAEILVGRNLAGPDALREAAREIHEMGPECVVIKGGHGEGDPIDLFYDGVSFTEIGGPRVATRSDHGTGCTFSAAVAALLALGVELRLAVEKARRFVEQAMKAAYPLGRGHGPLDHFYRFKRGEG